MRLDILAVFPPCEDVRDFMLSLRLQVSANRVLVDQYPFPAFRVSCCQCVAGLPALDHELVRLRHILDDDAVFLLHTIHGVVHNFFHCDLMGSLLHHGKRINHGVGMSQRAISVS